MSKRYLIINADDFGVNEETNAAIVEIFSKGVLSSTTLMTPCPAAQDAIHCTKQQALANVGLHLTFNSEWKRQWGAVSEASTVPSLLNETGCFHKTVADFAAQAQADDVAREMEAQYQYMVNNGVVPTHADNHMGSLYGTTGKPFMKEVIDFCAKHRLPFRFPRHIENMQQMLKLPAIPPALVAMHEQAVAYADANKVSLIDYLLTSTLPYSEITSYEVVKTTNMNLIRNLKEGISELFLHPSKQQAQMLQDYPQWQVRTWEYEFLLDDDLRALIASEDITLVSWTTAPFTHN